MYPRIVVFRVIVRRWHNIIVLTVFSSDERHNVYKNGTAVSRKIIHRKSFCRRVTHVCPSAYRRKSENRKNRPFSACYARTDLKRRQKRTGPYCSVISKHNGTGRTVARVPTLCTRATIAAIVVPHNRCDNHTIYTYIYIIVMRAYLAHNNVLCIPI